MKPAAALAVCAALLAASLTAPAASGAAVVQTEAPPPSWGLGLVVPQGALLAGGGAVNWGAASNLTALVRLPSLNATDDTVLVVLSAMVGESSVVQVAAGLSPGAKTWRAMGWFVPDVGAVPQEYVWVLNSSFPSLAPGSQVSMSLFRTAEGWGYGLAAVGQGQEAVGAFPGAPLAPFKVGDQEAFALESYTSNSSVLSSMGNLTLAAAEVDGARVVGGTYLFTDWDPSHNPLFVVGGQRAPGRVAVRVNGDGSVVWSYSPAWSGGGPTVPVTLVAALVALAAAPVALLAAALARGRGARQTL